MSRENHEQKAREQELWDRISTSTGADRAATFEELSHIAYNRDEWNESLSLVQSCIEIYSELDRELYKNDLVHVYEGAAHCYRNLERWADAAMAYQVIADLELETNYDNYLCATRHLACNWYNAGEYQKSLDGHQLAVAAVDPDATDHSLGIDNLNIGMCFTKLKQPLQAIDSYRKARELFKKEKNPRYVNWADKYLAESYIEVENGQEAKFHAKHFYNYSRVVQDDETEGMARYFLGAALYLCGEYEDAIGHLTVGLAKLTACDDRDWEAIVGANRELAQCYSAVGRDGEAAEILARIVTIEETLAD